MSVHFVSHLLNCAGYEARAYRPSDEQYNALIMGSCSDQSQRAGSQRKIERQTHRINLLIRLAPIFHARTDRPSFTPTHSQLCPAGPPLRCTCTTGSFPLQPSPCSRPEPGSYPPQRHSLLSGLFGNHTCATSKLAICGVNLVLVDRVACYHISSLCVRHRLCSLPFEFIDAPSRCRRLDLDPAPQWQPSLLHRRPTS